ncbi:MAG: phage tail protein [Lactobacillaceae bacterium]|nr:phage tail protein [Lactobacillaceae bacterium]
MFLFNRKQKVKRWLVDKDFIEAKMTEQINAAAKLVFSVPLKKRLPATYFFAAIPQPRGSGYLLFKIVTEQVQSDRVQYTCIEAAYDELKSYHYIKDDRPQDRTAAEMLQMALDGTRWSVGTAYDAGTGSTNFYYISSLEAIQKIADLFKLEVVFSISLDPNSHQIVRRLVNLYAQQGERTGKRFEYGSNLLSVEREESSENLITALIGRGKGEEKYHTADGKPSEEDQTPDGYGRRINFADVVWSTDNGNPVDKPAGQEYVEDPDATAAYGFDDGKPRIGIEIFEDITDPGELLQATWSALQTLKRPKVSFKANTLDVGDLGLGDTVAIIRHDIKIEYFTRVYKAEHNLLNEKQNTIELGDDFNGQSITSAINSIASAVKQTNQTANYASVSANGKNTNNYGKDRPSNAVEGDLWYKDLGNGEVDLYQYHDGNWILITSTRDLHNVQKQIDKQIDDLKKADEDGKKRDEEINQSIADTKKDLDTAKKESAAKSKSLEDDAADLRNRLGNVATQASKNADGITEISKKVSEVQITVANTQGDVNQLTIRADKTEQATRDADGRLNAVETTANGNKQTIATAQGDISQLTKRADALELNYKDANGKLNQLNITVDGLKQITTNQDGQINQFKVDINGLKNSLSDNNGKLSSIQIDLDSAKTILSNKADVSYVDQKANEWNVTVKKVDDLSKMTDMKVINSAINANDYRTSGHYFVKSTTSTNVPDTNWFYLDVSKGDDSRVTQTWQADNDISKRFSRIYRDGAWSGWQMVITNASLLGQINVTAGTTLLNNNRIFMDASSTVFSGKAFIPSAAITDLSADKITTGTLNAGNVNIINMNADNIVAGTIKGTNLSIGLNSGEVEFQHGRIHNLGNTVDIDLDKNYISTADFGTRVLLKNGELQLTEPSVYDTNNDSWYFKLTNWPDGNNYHTALLLGRHAITLSTGDGITNTGAWASSMGTIDFRGVSISENSPTVVGGGPSGMMLKAGTEMSIKHNIMDPNDGGVIMTGSPYILIGTAVSGWNGNRIIIDGEYVHIPSAERHTTGESPNVYVAPDGALVRSTSASKYKTMIERSHSLDYGERLLSLPTATWMDKDEERRFASGESKTKPVMHFGMIAEDLATAGLEMLVSRGQDGELEGIQYDRIAPALLPVIKDLQDRIEKLEEQLNGTKTIID